MPRSLLAAALLLAVLIVYLLSWPVPVEPTAWNAPADRGLVDPFEANDRLQRARLISLGDHAGPEDIAEGPDGRLYTGTQGGDILRFDPTGARLEVFASPGGRPLGLDFDAAGNLLVANAELGLQRISPDGSVENLLGGFNGEALSYVNDVAAHTDGSIYFSDSSSKFSARDPRGTFAAASLDIMEHGGHGRVFRYVPASKQTTVVLDNLNFANGVAVSTDGRFLMISETGSYRVLRHWLEGQGAGTTEVVMDNLPGFPDNLNNGLQDRFWLGLVMPRSSILDDMAGRPWLKKIVYRLPEALRPKGRHNSHVVAITGDGDVLMDLQDSGVRIAALTGVCETREALWLSSLYGHLVGRLDKRELANP